MEYSHDIFGVSTLLVIVSIIFIPLFSAVYYTKVLKPFLRMRAYIKMEIDRSDEEEYRYWKRQLKRLYVYHIPFVGCLICKVMK